MGDIIKMSSDSKSRLLHFCLTTCDCEYTLVLKANDHLLSQANNKTRSNHIQSPRMACQKFEEFFGPLAPYALHICTQPPPIFSHLPSTSSPFSLASARARLVQGSKWPRSDHLDAETSNVTPFPRRRGGRGGTGASDFLPGEVGWVINVVR